MSAEDPHAAALRQPVVKWAGSKRRVASQLHALWPPGRTRYLEPFVGGGSMLPGRPAPQALAGDLLPELIDLWGRIQRDPDDLARHYAACWHERQARGGVVYDEVRQRFNAQRSGADLLVLSRWCVNGLIRFNRAGDFNNSLHHTRPGIAPSRLAGILAAWSVSLQDVAFRAADYRETLADAGRRDAVFLDPPYRHTRGRYQPGGIDPDALFGELERLNHLGVPWMLTWDGQAGARAYEGGVPAGLFRRRLDLPTGQSPFPRLMKTGRDVVVESVFLGF